VLLKCVLPKEKKRNILQLNEGLQKFLARGEKDEERGRTNYAIEA
jgi:hypothetical protein